MIDLKMREVWREDTFKGHVQATVQPSPHLPRSGIFVFVNDHSELEDPSQPWGADAVMAHLENRFDKSVKRSEWIIDQVMRLKEEVG